MRPFILAALLFLPASASALDCTPFQSWTCAQQGYFNYFDGVPGEVVCGVDYTGWTLHVVEVTVAQAGMIHFAGVSAASTSPGTNVTTVLMLMDDCAAGTCLSSAQSGGVAELDVCLDVGTHTFVVASNTTAPGAVMNLGMACPTCAQAQSMGFACSYCNPVGDVDVPWGSVKTQYR